MSGGYVHGGEEHELPFSEPDTSKAAAESMEESVARQRGQVLAYFKRVGQFGSTDQEGQDETGIDGNSWRPRRGELVARGLVEDSGRKRSGRSKRPAKVWIYTGRDRSAG